MKLVPTGGYLPHAAKRWVSERLVLSVLTVLVLIWAAGCKGTTSNDTSVGVASSCDPLAGKPITLGTVIGVGKDSNGTLYVDSSNGIFVSSGGELIRQHVIGTGQSGSDEYLFTIEPPAGDGAQAQNLLVETKGTTASAMALGPVGSKAFLNEAGSSVTALELVDRATVSGMVPVNTPNLISYLADVENGNVVLATVPMNEDPASTDLGLSIFYGPPSAVVERKVSDFGETLSGNGSLTFLVDGTPYVLAFGQEPEPDAGPLGVFMLQGLTPQGGAPLTVTLRTPTPTTVPAELMVSCVP